MQVAGRAASGATHHVLVALPGLVLRVLIQRLALEVLELRGIARAQEFRAPPHHRRRRPALGIDDVRALERRRHRVGQRERAAGLTRETARRRDRFVHQVVAGRMRQHDVHAEPRHQRDDALRNRQRLAVAGRIGPAHRQLLAPEAVEAAADLHEVREIGQTLGGMVEIRLQVEHGRPLQQHALAMACGHRRRHLALVRVALTQEHVVPDADDLGEEADHRGRLAHRLAVRDLRRGLIQLLRHQPQQVAAGAERVAGAGGMVTEDRQPQAGVEHPARDARAREVLQRRRRVEHGPDRGRVVLPGEQEVAVIEPVHRAVSRKQRGNAA